MANAHLLDTHAVVWALVDDPRLPESTRRVLLDPDAAILVSAVSVWEVTLKGDRLGLAAARPFVEGFSGFVRRSGFAFLPLTETHAQRQASLAWPHRDPFDRMLACQALVEEVTLVTRDDAFTSVPGLRIRW